MAHQLPAAHHFDGERHRRAHADLADCADRALLIMPGFQRDGIAPARFQGQRVGRHISGQRNPLFPCGTRHSQQQRPGIAHCPGHCDSLAQHNIVRGKSVGADRRLHGHGRLFARAIQHKQRRHHRCQRANDQQWQQQHGQPARQHPALDVGARHRRREARWVARAGDHGEFAHRRRSKQLPPPAVDCTGHRLPLAGHERHMRRRQLDNERIAPVCAAKINGQRGVALVVQEDLERLPVEQALAAQRHAEPAEG